MAEGIWLSRLGVRTRPCRIERTGKNAFRIILTQGLNRQIRRMCGAVGAEVVRLKRVRVLNVLLGDMRPGEQRQIRGRELETLYREAGLRAPAEEKRGEERG
jgi:23S rRNA pseudouridine2604 synthase